MLCFIFFPVVTGTFAQENKAPNLPEYDTQKVRFGFTLGFISADFKLVQNKDIRAVTMDSVYSVESQPQPGFLIGVISNLRLGNHLDVRFVPGLSFTQRKLLYTMNPAYAVTSPVIKKVESSYLDFPLTLKVKSSRLNNFLVYVLAGGKYSIDLVAPADTGAGNMQAVRLKPYDYGYEIGLGFDLYLKHFKFGLEIKMYNGLNNLLVNDGSMYTSAIESLNSKIFYISLLFE